MSYYPSYQSFGFYDDYDGPGGGMHRSTRRFDEYYRCYPVAMMTTGRENLNYGGKVIMPASALDKLTRLHISYPMLFELHNGRGKMTHSGVLEFVAEEGRIYLPQWIMQTLLLEPGDLLQVKSTDLPPGSFIKLQPQSVEFLDISDPKAVLENALRNFSALTKDDIFSFSYNDTVFEIAVLEVKPDARNSAISVTETDLEVDFAPPVGYVEPARSKAPSSVNSTRPSSALAGGFANAGQGAMAAQIGYQDLAPGSSSSKHLKPSDAFSGAGQKLVNRKSKSKPGTPAPPPPPPSSAAPPTPSVRLPTNGKIIDTTTLMRDGKPPPAPLRVPFGTLFFGYEIKPVKKTEGGDTEPSKSTFSGQGQSLRSAAKRKDRDESTDSKGKGKAPASSSSGPSAGRTLRGKEVIEID
ncbi:hypothetical protein ABW21_db0203554 [Orbilia brochopaga]|nr:hypothetical protein ABW21_db0203554 [Drechslerella brochopaga]